jgi:hypothetical protein
MLQFVNNCFNMFRPNNISYFSLKHKPRLTNKQCKVAYISRIFMATFMQLYDHLVGIKREYD